MNYFCTHFVSNYINQSLNEVPLQQKTVEQINQFISVTLDLITWVTLGCQSRTAFWLWRLQIFKRVCLIHS